MQDDFINQIRNFMKNFHDGLLTLPPGEDKEHEATMDTELLSTEDIQPLAVQDPPHDSDIRQLIREECNINFLCMHDNVDDLIESALDSKLLSINSINSQHLSKKEQEVKNVEEQPAERRNHAEKSLQNFRVIHKSSISLKDTSQISSVYAVAPILSTKEPENSLSMGYEHLNITPETGSDEVTESNAKNLLPIPSECEVTSEDKRECDVPVCENSYTIDDNHSKILFDSNNDDDILSDDESSEDIEYIDASLPDPEITSVEEENVVHQEEEEIDLEDIQDIVLREKLCSINRLFANIESLKDKPTPFRFEIEPDQEKLFSAAMNDISDNSSNDPLLEEVNLFLATDHSIPPGIKKFYDPEGDICFLKALLIDDFIPFSVNESFDFENDPSIPRPPLKPPDEETNPEVILAVMENIDEPNESFDPRGEIFVSTNDEDVDYFPFMFVIRIFLPYLIHPEISPLFLSTESEDTVFDPGISD
nr:hypothetical protein [Tanacetum cinerariifolium]